MNLKFAKAFLIGIVAMSVVLGTIGCSNEPPGGTNASETGTEKGKGQPENPAFDPNK